MVYKSLNYRDRVALPSGADGAGIAWCPVGAACGSSRSELEAAGFRDVEARRLVPGEAYWSFLGENPR